MSTATRPITTEEMLAMPSGEVDRELYDGELKEKPMTKRNRTHSNVVACVTHYLMAWCLAQPQRPGDVFSGEAGFILQRNPDTTVGIDVAFVSQEVLDRQSDETTLIDGAPLLAVEVLFPSDTHEEIKRKVDKYLSAGTALVWIVDPDFRTVTVYSPAGEPTLFNEKQDISAEPHLPGFVVAVAELFH